MATLTHKGVDFEVDLSEFPTDEGLNNHLENLYIEHQSQLADELNAEIEANDNTTETTPKISNLKKGGEIIEGAVTGVAEAGSNIYNLSDRALLGLPKKLSVIADDAIEHLGYTVNSPILAKGLPFIAVGDNKVGINWSNDDTDDDVTMDYTIFDLETAYGKVTKPFAQFLTGFGISSKFTKGSKVFRNSNKSKKVDLAKATTDAVIGEQIAFNPFEERVSDMLQSFETIELSEQGEGLFNKAIYRPVDILTTYLSSDENDTEAEARLKMLGEALVLEGVALPIVAIFRTIKNTRAGKPVNINDEQELAKFIDEIAPEADVEIKELTEKLKVKAEEAFVKQNETVQSVSQLKNIDAITSKDAKSLKAEASKNLKKVLGKDFDSWAKKSGYSQLWQPKTNKKLIRQADDIIAENFGDSKTISEALLNIRRVAFKPEDFDLYMTISGRLQQLAWNNYSKALTIKNNDLKKVRDDYFKVDSEVGLSGFDKSIKKMNLIADANKIQHTFRQSRDDLLRSAFNFTIAKSTAGRSLQINKLFQGFDVPAVQIEEHFDKLLAKTSNQKVAQGFVFMALDQLLKKSGNILKALDEIFIANILTGVKTHVVNTVSNTAMTIYKPTEMLLASGIRAVYDPKGAYQQFRTGLYTFEGILRGHNENFKIAMDTYLHGRNFMDSQQLFEQQGKSVLGTELRFRHGFSSKHLKKLAQDIDLHGDKLTLSDMILSVPVTALKLFNTRLISMEDAYFKSTNFRASVFARAKNEQMNLLYKQGLRGKELVQTATKNANDAVTLAVDEQMMKNANEAYDIQLSKFADGALQYARETTFTQNLGKYSQAFSDAVSTIPLMRQIFPFIRTPLNLISDTIQRSPLAPISGRWWTNLRAGGEQRALALTQLSLGVGLYTTMAQYYSWDMSEIPMTGVGEGNFNLRENQREIGRFLDQSIIKDGTQYQIKRLDPFFTIFESFGVIGELNKRGLYKEADELIMANSIALTRMLANDTYATTIRQLMTALEDDTGARYYDFMKQRVQQLAPYSTLTLSVKNADEQFNKELRTFTDSIASVIPMWDAKLPNKYNLFGEPVERFKAGNMFDWWSTGHTARWASNILNPITVAEQIKPELDPVGFEVVSQNVSTGDFTRYPQEYAGMVDLYNERFSVDAEGNPLYEGVPDDILGENLYPERSKLLFLETSGFNAFDRLNEIMKTQPVLNGLNLRGTLDYIINLDAYKNNTTEDIVIDVPYGKNNRKLFKGTKAEILQQVITSAKRQALATLEKENPNLMQEKIRMEKIEAVRKSKEFRALTNDGQNMDNVFEELNSVLTGAGN